MTIELPSPADTADRWPQTLDEFECKVVALQDGLVHFARCRLGNQQDAEDVVQDVLVRAWAQRISLASVDRFTPYVYRMTANRCTDLLRRRARILPWRRSQPTFDETGVSELIDHLPTDQAEVVRLKLWTGLTFAEIAEAMSSSVPTAKSRVRYAIDRLRTLLNRGEAS